jgi:hypothetical protein
LFKDRENVFQSRGKWESEFEKMSVMCRKWICKKHILKMNCNIELINRNGPSSKMLDSGVGELYFDRMPKSQNLE